VTLLSILGTKSIAVPLSSGFPASELRYILDNSEALVLLSSAKFQSKAQEVIKEDLKEKPIVGNIEKRHNGGSSDKHITLEDVGDHDGGMMLYTSGTTNRPVRSVNYLFDLANTRNRKEYSFQNMSLLRRLDRS
jgi:malonyl-CoA/methylmalonyl-CoA synthetase